MTAMLTLVSALGSNEIEAEVSATSVLISADHFTTVTGWTLKPEGFCLNDICIPARNAVDDQGKVDLAKFASLSDAPLIIDAANAVASLGASSAARANQLSSLEAPDFSLPDLNGQMHSLSDYKGKKVLLAAYASW